MRQAQIYLIFSEKLKTPTPLEVMRAERGLQNVRFVGHYRIIHSRQPKSISSSEKHAKISLYIPQQVLVEAVHHFD